MRMHAVRSAGSAARRSSASRGATTRPIKTERLSKSTTDPKAVSAAARICPSASSAALSKAGTASIRRCPTNSIKSRRRSPAACARRAARSASISSPDRPSNAARAFCPSSSSPAIEDLQQRRHARRISQSLEDAKRREPRRFRAALGRLQYRGQRRGVAAIGQGQHQQSLPVRRRLAQLRHDRLGSRSSRKLAGYSQTELEERRVGRLQLFDQKRNAGGLPSENRPAGRLENSRLGNIGVAHDVVQPDRFGLLPLRRDVSPRTEYTPPQQPNARRPGHPPAIAPRPSWPRRRRCVPEPRRRRTPLRRRNPAAAGPRPRRPSHRDACRSS